MCTETPPKQFPSPFAFGSQRQTPSSAVVRPPVRAQFFDAGDPEQVQTGPPRTRPTRRSPFPEGFDEFDEFFVPGGESRRPRTRNDIIDFLRGMGLNSQ